MTSEERFTKIENLLSAMTEHHARHAEEIQELREMHKGVVVVITRVVEAQLATDQRLNTLTETVSGLAGTVRGLTETVSAVAEQQQVTEEKMHALIDTVDRIIRMK